MSLLLATCTAETSPAPVEAPDVATPNHCEPDGVKDRLVRLFDLANSGDGEGFRDAFAPEETFAWFSLSDQVSGRAKEHTSIHEPGRLVAYIEKRTSVNEETALLEVEVRHDPERQNKAAITLLMRQGAEDMEGPEGGIFIAGKAEIGCSDGRFLVMSLGANDAGLDDPCPKSKGTAQAPVTCVPKLG